MGQKSLQLGHRQSLGDVITLHAIATQAIELLQRLRVFDTLGHHPEAEVLGQVDGRT